MNKKILICLTKPFHFRNLVYSPLFQSLTDSSDLTILVPGQITNKEFMEHELNGVNIEVLEYSSPKIERYLSFIRKYVLANRERIQTKNLINKLERRGNSFKFRLARLLNLVFGRWHFFFKSWRYLEDLLFSSSMFNDLLGRGYDLVLCQNYGTDPYEIKLYRSAKKLGIKTVSIVPSFDNLSSKGIIGSEPDFLFVWNDQMKKEAIRYHGINPAKLKVIGALQFDHHRKASNVVGKTKRTPSLVYATVTPKYFPHNLSVVKSILDQVELGYLSGDLKITIRVHPQVLYDTEFGEDIDHYLAFARENKNVELSLPKMTNLGLFNVPEKSDFVELITILKNADVLLAPASTILLDAAALGTPVIGLGFDGLHTQKYEGHVSGFFEFEHMKSLMHYKFFEVASSPSHFVKIFNQIVGDENYKALETLRINSDFLNNESGQVHESALSHLNEIISSQ